MPKSDQRGIVQVLVILILLIGIVAGFYLVNYTVTNLKPKAYESNPSGNIINSSEFDNPPELATNPFGTRSLLFDIAQVEDYKVTVVNEGEDIKLNFTPEELTEEQAKQKLQNAPLFFQRVIMYLLLNPYRSTPDPQIDPWYALCDHLTEEKLAEVGVEPTILSNGEQLQCLDPVPSKDQFYLTDPHVHLLYVKISAKDLLRAEKYAEQFRDSKNQFLRAAEFAASFAPFYGPTFYAHQNPASKGSAPLDVAGNTLRYTSVFLAAIVAGQYMLAAGGVEGIIYHPQLIKVTGNTVVINYAQHIADGLDDVLPFLQSALEFVPKGIPFEIVFSKQK